MKSIRITLLPGHDYRLPFDVRITSLYRVRDGAEIVNYIPERLVTFLHKRRLLRQAFLCYIK